MNARVDASWPKRTCIGLVGTMLACSLASTAAAQIRDSVRIPMPGARTLVGLVVDTAGAPIMDAEVVVESQRQRAFTAPDGSFRLEGLKPGKYRLTARKLGFFPQGQMVDVGENGGAAAFELRSRGPATLPTVVSSAVRGGLSGVVGDTAYNPLAGATIWALASDRRATTDSTGMFFLDLKPGRHMVRVERPGHSSRLVSVTIPRDSGRRVAVWLPVASRGSQAREKQNIMAFSDRLMRRSPVWSKIFTREDILRSSMKTADRFATAGAGKLIPDYCLAIVDGGPFYEPLWVIDAADIETMEVYSSRPSSLKQRNSLTVGGLDFGGGARLPPQPRECIGTNIYIWLRK